MLIEAEDVGLCANEVAKMIAVLRTTERYSDITRPSIMWPREVLAHVSASETPQSNVSTAGTSSASSSPLASFVMPAAEAATSINTVAQLLDLQQNLNRGKEVMQVLTPFMHVVVDPSLSGYVTAAALASTMNLLLFGSSASFIENNQVVCGILDCVTKTKFTETNRDHDETVLLRIVSIVEYLLTRSIAVDKARVAAGLQCVQTIWIQDSHSAALSDLARSAVFNILIHVMAMPDGCDGYASTLMDNVCLNMELLARQPPSGFDMDKLAFFIDVLSRAPFSPTVPFELMHALYFLLPPGPAAAAVDNTSQGIIARNSQAMPLAASLLSIGNSLIRGSTNLLLIEALVSSMYCRALTPVSADVKLVGLGELALHLVTSSNRKSNPGPSSNGYISLVQSAAIASQLAPLTQQIQATLLESLNQLLKQPDLIASLWENYDSVWHRTALASSLIDGVVHMALSNKVIALLSAEESVDRDRVQKALASFYSLATSPESLIDPDALVPSYIECLAVDVLKEVVLSLHLTAEGATGATGEEDNTAQHFLTRSAAKEVAKQIKSKPRKSGEIVSRFLSEFESHIAAPTAASQYETIAWGLRVIPSIDFDALGEFFGQPGEVSTQSMSAFIRSLDLKNMDPEEALRACLQSFRLPGEAQQIDRIVKEIAYEYYNSHSDLSIPGNFFASADAAYTFLFSVIMLNTDQHNPQVKKRMELRDFLRNNRKINDGEDIPEEVQTRVFNSIRNSQIVTPKSGSYFCAPLKGRWKDLWHLHATGYIPSASKRAKNHSVFRLLASKGYDMMIAAAYVLARDPKRYTRSVEVIAGLADVCLGRNALNVDPIVRSLGADCVSVLRRYALKSFATSVSNIVPTPRSYACVSALLRLEVGATADALLESASSILSYWAPYEPLLHALSEEPLWPSDSSLNLKKVWEEVLATPLVDDTSAGASESAFSSLFRGFLNPLLDESPDSAHPKSEPPEINVSNEEQVVSDWRRSILRSSFSESSSSCPSIQQLLALKGIEVENFIAQSVTEYDGSKISAVVLMMFELISNTGKTAGSQDYWKKELVRSSPWSLLLATRILTGSKHSDLIAASAARDALITILKHFSSGQLTDLQGLKVTVFVGFYLVSFLARRDPDSNVVDPAWLLPVLDEITSLASSSSSSSSSSSLLTSIGPTVANSIKAMLSESPPEWISKLGAPVWRECIKLLAAVCPKRLRSDKSCQETALELILNQHVLASFLAATNGANDMTDCIVAYEEILQNRLPSKAVSKTLTEIACELAALGADMPGAGLAWTAVVSRINVRITAVAKQRKQTGPELSDSVELLRICLGHPKAPHILSPLQAGVTVEKCASTLSAVVSALITPGGALQAALSVFARFFLTCLDKLNKHPQFDHLWLMSLRVILLFIKRGHEDPSLEQLAEVTTETLRNALQVLLASSLLELPPVEDTDASATESSPVIWWKVTWEIVETFCPGLWTELRDHLDSQSKQAVEVEDNHIVDKVEM